MIHIPSSPHTRIVFAGIDPGTTKLGLAYLEYDVVLQKLMRVHASTLRGDRLMRMTKSHEPHGDRFARIQMLGVALEESFVKHQPLVISSESPYFNSLQPGAYAALVEILVEIRQAVYRYRPWTQLELFAPSPVKKALNVVGRSGDKNLMRNGIKEIPEIMDVLENNIDDLDEHAIDSIAVGYCSILQFIRGGSWQ